MYSIRYQGKIAWHKEAGISLSFKKLNKKKRIDHGSNWWIWAFKIFSIKFNSVVAWAFINSEPTQQLKQKKWRSQHNSGIRIWSHTKLIHKDMFNIQTQSSYNLHGSIFVGTPKPIMGLIHAPWLPICCDWQCMFVSHELLIQTTHQLCTISDNNVKHQVSAFLVHLNTLSTTRHFPSIFIILEKLHKSNFIDCE